MPRATLGKQVKPRQRRSQIGPTRARVPDGDPLQTLRSRLASTEVVGNSSD
jgi:hypothetical protein